MIGQPQLYWYFYSTRFTRQKWSGFFPNTSFDW